MAALFEDVEDNIFRNRDVLTEDYQPEDIYNREGEIEKYEETLQPVVKGQSPRDIITYGNTGVGKTVVTKHVLGELERVMKERGQEDELHVVHHNCNSNTVFSVVRALVNELRGPNEAEFPRRGLSVADAFDALYEKIDEMGGRFVFAFDEIDHVADSDTLLYELTRAKSVGNITNEESAITVIGISNDLNFHNNLGAKVAGALKEREIVFEPYDALDLQKILNKRATEALFEDAYDEGVIQLCAAFGAQDKGDARQGIDILREAGEIADRSGHAVITTADVEAAKERVERGRVRKNMRTLTEQAKMVLTATAYLDINDRTPARTDDIFDAYNTITEKITDFSQLTTKKSINNHLNDLSMMGFLIKYERNEGRAGGTYNEYKCDYDAEAVIETISDEFGIDIE
ncbi:Cdc6/Cdc18 family protein [Halobium salinum]|uniref:ORC1-type DNA replication protein n=1 Tax=Halobium salinum TaxID=1364940 RepID=A0ABD5P8M7_9EURY|nr:orc1/cdc6 family replication initiation protein [Halobium salinum]